MPELDPSLFLHPETAVTMGVPPLRIDSLTSIAGTSFDDCFDRRDVVSVGEIRVPIISLADLGVNKKPTGRGQALADVEPLP